MLSRAPEEWQKDFQKILVRVDSGVEQENGGQSLFHVAEMLPSPRFIPLAIGCVRIHTLLRTTREAGRETRHAVLAMSRSAVVR